MYGLRCMYKNRAQPHWKAYHHPLLLLSTTSVWPTWCLGKPSSRDWGTALPGLKKPVIPLWSSSSHNPHLIVPLPGNLFLHIGSSLVTRIISVTHTWNSRKRSSLASLTVKGFTPPTRLVISTLETIWEAHHFERELNSAGPCLTCVTLRVVFLPVSGRPLSTLCRHHKLNPLCQF